MLRDEILKEYQRNLKTFTPEKLINCDEIYYRKMWQIHANHFTEKGYYEWMAETLKSHVTPKTLLDIGCGTGDSIIQLLKAIPSLEHIITVELNAQCIEETKRKLKEAGYTVNAIKRNTPKLLDKQTGLFQNVFTPITDLPLSAQVTIIEGDIHIDTQLFTFLSENIKVDAVTCWLIAMHPSSERNIDLINNSYVNIPNYRLYVEKKVYELADKVLTPNGILQIVDRKPNAPVGKVADDVKKLHEDQASVTRLKIAQIRNLSYEMPEDGIPMVQTGNEQPLEKPDPHLVSIISGF